MNAKERVYRAIERRAPDHLPIYYFNRDIECSDVINAAVDPADTFMPQHPEQTEWGYTWKRLDRTMGQPEDYPLADAAKIDTYVPPDAQARGRLKSIKQTVAAYPDRFAKVNLGITGFNQATFLRGMTNFLSDLCLERDLAEQVLDFVFDYENSVIERLEFIAVDGISFGDDWGTQKGLFIAPALWREVLKPRYARQFELAHRLGKKVWFHSCGNILDILDDLIEIGADVLELLQPDIFGVEPLGQRFGGRVCFCCSVDHQRRAISGTQQEIMDYARHLHAHLGCFSGGLIGYVEDYASLGMSEDHYQWICKAFGALGAEKQVSLGLGATG